MPYGSGGSRRPPRRPGRAPLRPDPVARFSRHLHDCGVPPESLDEVEMSARAEVAKAAEQALADPPADPLGVTRDVYV